MADMKTLTTREEIWATLKPFTKSWIPQEFLKQLIWSLDRGAISAVAVPVGTSATRWDGTIHITLAKAEIHYVINKLVQPSRADEVSMPDKNTLRLWWD